ncbi:hypothetical protein Tco_1177235 [Tanacetum coccineum]
MATTDRITGALPSEVVKNPKLNVNFITLVFSARFYPTEDPQCSTRIHSSINAITICPKQPDKSRNNNPGGEEQEETDNSKNINTNPSSPPDPSVSFVTKKVYKLNSFLESLTLVPQPSDIEYVCTKGDDGDVMFNEIIKNYGYSREEGPGVDAETGELEVEYFDTLPTKSELAYHKYLMSGPITSIFMRNPIITEGCPSNLKIPCNIGQIMRRKLDPRDFMIVKDISSIIDPRLSQVVLGKPFVEMSNMTHDPSEGVVRITNETNEITYKMPHKIEQYNSLSDLEKEHTKSVYLRNEEDKRRGVEYVMSKIFRFYKECLELRPEYLIGVADEEEVT